MAFFNLLFRVSSFFAVVSQPMYCFR
jgi:hypothetical protein